MKGFLSAIENVNQILYGIEAASTTLYGSVLLQDLVLCLSSSSITSLPTLVPPSIRHLAIVNCFMLLIRYMVAAESKRISIDQWASPLGLQIIEKLGKLQIRLLLEKTILEGLDVDSQSEEMCDSLQGQIACVYKIIKSMAGPSNGTTAKMDDPSDPKVIRNKHLSPLVNIIAEFHGEFRKLFGYLYKASYCLNMFHQFTD